MSANALAWPLTGVRRVLSDQEYVVVPTRAGMGTLAASSGEIWPTQAEKLRLKVSSVLGSIAIEAAGPKVDWLLPVLESAGALQNLQEDWDSYGAPPISNEAITRAIELLAEIMSPNSTPPALVPMSSGGCQLEWHSAGRDLEIEVSPGGEVSVSFDDRVRNSQGEGPLPIYMHNVSALVRDIGH